VRRFQRGNSDWRLLPEKAAIQMNDTHPALAVPELMRILVDQAHLGWDEAWHITQNTLAYTNHTLLAEALEKWPLAVFEDMLPRQLEIIYEINRRFLGDVRLRFPGDEGRIQRVSLIEEGAGKKVRMANLAFAGAQSLYLGPVQDDLIPVDRVRMGIRVHDLAVLGFDEAQRVVAVRVGDVRGDELPAADSVLNQSVFRCDPLLVRTGGKRRWWAIVRRLGRRLACDRRGRRSSANASHRPERRDMPRLDR